MTATPATEGHRHPIEDADRWYRAIVSRDPRFDGWILVGVTSTGIYCRPSCPTPVRPKRANVTFHRTAAAAQRAGFRACKRCRPDAVPGSPAWDIRGDLVGRAMRSIADGAIDRDGVPSLAASLAVSERHLRRVLTEELGAGPLAIARANRAQTARVLIETTSLPFSEVAFAAGFQSIRQFGATIREVYASTPTQLRRNVSRAATAARSGGADLRVRLPVRAPFDGHSLLGWFAARAVAGVEDVSNTRLVRTLSLPHGPAIVSLEPAEDHVLAVLQLHSVADLGTVVARLRRLFDLDADPATVAERLAVDPTMAALVRARPGLRVPGAVDGPEVVVRAVLGQQISVAGAATAAARLARLAGDPAPTNDHGLTHLFPRPERLAALDPAVLGMPAARARALVEVAGLLASGTLDVGIGADRSEVRARLLAVRGIGPWTADYIVLRALGDPDVLLQGDLIVRRRAQDLGLPEDLERWSRPLSPWRSYVTHHLWSSTTPPA